MRAEIMMIRRIKLNHRIFEVSVLDPDISRIVLEGSFWDTSVKIGDQVVHVRFGVDRMWIAYDGRVIMVRPKTCSLDEIRRLVSELLCSIVSR
ncbi:MAG: hypothetical protein GXO10_05525 [Crenarchaeota archaeon]|nr:hypothetical protein [Thermoproteota archaeon]